MATGTAHAVTSTRRRLFEVGVEMFAACGYDNVTTEEIAAAAGVTQRTFFRHFPTKVDVLFADADAATEEFVAMLYRQPPGPVTDALVEALAEHEQMMQLDGYSALVSRILTDTPSLQEARRGYEARFERMLAEWIAQRWGVEPDDYDVRVLAAMLVAARRVCIDEWRRAPQPTSVVPLARRALSAIDRAWPVRDA